MVLVTPTLTRLPAPVGGIRSAAGVTDDAGRFSAFLRIWNVTGQPAISLPLARTDRWRTDRCPTGRGTRSRRRPDQSGITTRGSCRLASTCHDGERVSVGTPSRKGEVMYLGIYDIEGDPNGLLVPTIG